MQRIWAGGLLLVMTLPVLASPADQLGTVKKEQSFDLGVGNQQFNPLADGINKKQKVYQKEFVRDYVTPQSLMKVGFNNCLTGPPSKALQQAFNTPAPLRQLGQLGSTGDVPIRLNVMPCPKSPE